MPIIEAYALEITSIIQADWSDERRDKPDYRNLASEAICRFIFPQGDKVASQDARLTDDIAAMREHFGLDAQHGRTSSANWVYDLTCNMSYPLPGIHAALSIVHRSARILKEDVEVIVSTPQGMVTLEYDHAAMSSAKDGRKEVAPGARVTIVYEGSRMIRKIHIKAHAGDRAADPEFLSITPESPIARKMEGLSVNDCFTIEVDGRLQPCAILEVVRDPA